MSHASNAQAQESKRVESQGGRVESTGRLYVQYHARHRAALRTRPEHARSSAHERRRARYAAARRALLLRARRPGIRLLLGVRESGFRRIGYLDEISPRFSAALPSSATRVGELPASRIVRQAGHGARRKSPVLGGARHQRMLLELLPQSRPASAQRGHHADAALLRTLPGRDIPRRVLFRRRCVRKH